jgi:hypothetical protein
MVCRGQKSIASEWDRSEFVLFGAVYCTNLARAPKEELVVRKDVEQRTETISDTVRSTEVDVEDERGNAANRPGTTDRT